MAPLMCFCREVGLWVTGCPVDGVTDWTLKSNPSNWIYAAFSELDFAP